MCVNFVKNISYIPSRHITLQIAEGTLRTVSIALNILMGINHYKNSLEQPRIRLVPEALHVKLMKHPIYYWNTRIFHEILDFGSAYLGVKTYFNPRITPVFYLLTALNMVISG